MSARQVFSHSGDLGDVLACLPSIRAVGGGELVLFPSHATGYRMTPDRAVTLIPLLAAQPYIQSATWEPESRGHNLDVWRGRSRFLPGVSLAHLQAQAMGAPPPHPERPWLKVKPRKEWPIIVSRGPRWRNDRFPWHKVYEAYRGQMGYVGLPDEHQAFCDAIGPVPYLPTKDFLELAEVIAGCQMYVGSQSSPFWVAEGLKKLIVLERSLKHDNSWISRPGQLFGVNESFDPPAFADVERLASEQAARVFLHSGE